ncbi:MAG: ubiquinol-cytochrome C chaperone family protein, partial [Rhodospirillaceae bacterium]
EDAAALAQCLQQGPSDDGEALLIALDNNLYGTVMDPDPRVLTLMADYTRKSVTNLDAQPLRQVLEGFVYFIEPLY